MMKCVLFGNFFGCLHLYFFLHLNWQPFYQYQPADEQTHNQKARETGQRAAKHCVKARLQEQKW